MATLRRVFGLSDGHIVSTTDLVKDPNAEKLDSESTAEDLQDNITSLRRMESCSMILGPFKDEGREVDGDSERLHVASEISKVYHQACAHVANKPARHRRIPMERMIDVRICRNDKRTRLLRPRIRQQSSQLCIGPQWSDLSRAFSQEYSTFT